MQKKNARTYIHINICTRTHTHTYIYIYTYMYTHIFTFTFAYIYVYAREYSYVFLKLDGNSTRMLRSMLNRSWRQHPTNQQLYGHLPPITKTILIRRTRHAGHCWRSRDELISGVLLWTPLHGRAKAG